MQMSEAIFVTGNHKTTTTTTKSVNSGISQVNSPFLTRQSQGNQQTSAAMPHYGGGAEKCARCLKNVYLAEKKVGAGRSFHSSCFSCETCNRKLDATTLSEHKGEIYCKTCYTRQFGVHGLVSGVTMSTEHPVHEVRHSRRSSYGSDLDAPVITHKQTRPRAHSNDNMLRGEHGPAQNDEVSKMFPWRNEVLPEQSQHSPTKNTLTTTFDEIVNRPYARPTSQIGFEKVIQSTTNENPSVHTGETDRHKYFFGDNETSHSNGTSALINMPVVSPPKRSNSQVDRVEMPTPPTTYTQQRSQSPSPTTTETYRQPTSRERHTDISDNFSRLTLNDRQNEMNNKNFATDKITTENPLIKHTYSHSSSYEDKQISSNTVRDRSRSRESSPSATGTSNRSPSPTSGYASSSAHGDGIIRDSTSPPSAFVPQHDYLNTRASNGSVIERQSPSSQNERTSTAMHDFVSKTNTITSPTTGGKYATLAALIKPHRPLSQMNNANNDDDFDN